jgi:GeoRSP system PqqD family protein
MGQVIVRNPDVLWREEEEARQEAETGLQQGDDVGGLGTALLFSGGEMVVLNLLGAEIWQRCDRKDADHLIAELLEEFDVAEQLLRADVSAFLTELQGKGFISYE